MKFRHPFFIKLIGLLIAWLVPRWVASLGFRYHPLGGNLLPGRHQRGRFIYSFWHENITSLTFRFAGSDLSVLISEHADGRLISEACRHLRVLVISGSSTREGVKAIRKLIKLQGRHVVITPDGPRGPRREVKPGLVYLASRCGLPIVPVGVGYRKAWRLKSWDRFALPCPLSGTICVTGKEIFIPVDADRHELERCRLQVQLEMDRVTQEAERLAGEELRSVA